MKPPSRQASVIMRPTRTVIVRSPAMQKAIAAGSCAKLERLLHLTHKFHASGSDQPSARRANRACAAWRVRGLDVVHARTISG
jgi:hypothetical protein